MFIYLHVGYYYNYYNYYCSPCLNYGLIQVHHPRVPATETLAEVEGAEETCLPHHLALRIG